MASSSFNALLISERFLPIFISPLFLLCAYHIIQKFVCQTKVYVFCTVSKNAVVPSYQTEGAAGADVCACIEQDIILEPGKRTLVPTGLCMEIPAGYEIQVRPRSGLAVKHGITCLNTPGTIDSDYRGEIMVALHNHSGKAQTVADGERIAQIVFAPYYVADFTVVDELGDTVRGEGGFGSTGTK